MQGELFHADTHHQATQGELFCAQDPARGDFATNDTSAATDTGQHKTIIATARPQQGNAETDITTAPENCTKNAQFSPAKAMAVSVTARPAPAKATEVSDNPSACPTGPGCGATGGGGT